jgi:hypothetical protein
MVARRLRLLSLLPEAPQQPTTAEQTQGEDREQG